MHWFPAPFFLILLFRRICLSGATYIQTDEGIRYWYPEYDPTMNPVENTKLSKSKSKWLSCFSPRRSAEPAPVLNQPNLQYYREKFESDFGIRPRNRIQLAQSAFAYLLTVQDMELEKLDEWMSMLVKLGKDVVTDGETQRQPLDLHVHVALGFQTLYLKHSKNNDLVPAILLKLKELNELVGSSKSSITQGWGRAIFQSDLDRRSEFMGEEGSLLAITNTDPHLLRDIGLSLAKTGTTQMIDGLKKFKEIFSLETQQNFSAYTRIASIALMNHMYPKLHMKKPVTELANTLLTKQSEFFLFKNEREMLEKLVSASSGTT